MVCLCYRQLYILGSIESPIHTEILEKYHKFRNYFNVSMNYMRDADIRLNNFGRVVRVRDHPEPGPELDKIIKRFGRENKHMASKENKVNSKDMHKSLYLIGIFKTRRAAVPLLLSLFLTAKLSVAGKRQ